MFWKIKMANKLPGQIYSEGLEKRLREEDQELLERAKTKEECVVRLRGEIKYVLGSSYPTKVRVRAIRPGTPRRTEEDGGYTSHLVIDFKPLLPEYSVKRLNFFGQSTIEKGDLVEVGIFAGEERALRLPTEDPRAIKKDLNRGPYHAYHHDTEYFVLVKRPLQESEEALYIEVLGRGRKDRSANYPEVFSD
jgi:hypothetical protein